jgi:hypothetical protein
MKTKQTVFCTNIDALLRSDLSACLTLFETEDCIPNAWVKVAEVEFEVNLDVDGMRQAAIVATDVEIADIKEAAIVRLEKLEARKKDLLALTYNSEE